MVGLQTDIKYDICKVADFSVKHRCLTISREVVLILAHPRIAKFTVKKYYRKTKSSEVKQSKVFIFNLFIISFNCNGKI